MSAQASLEITKTQKGAPFGALFIGGECRLTGQRINSDPMMISEKLIITNHYQLIQSAERFHLAIKALVARVEKEGHAGVLAYRFYVNETENCARGIIEYANPDGWIGHHDTSMGWPEMKALHSVANLVHVTFHGPVNQSILNWINSSSLTATLSTGNEFAAGFERS